MNISELQQQRLNGIEQLILSGKQQEGKQEAEGFLQELLSDNIPENADIFLQLYILLGIACRQLQDYNRAIEYFQKAEQGFFALGNKVQEFIAKDNKAKTFVQMQEFSKAEELYHYIIANLQEHNDVALHANCLGWLGRIYEMTAQYPLAIEQYNLALDIFNKLQQPIKVITALNNLGNIYSDVGDFNHAVEHYIQALHIAEKEQLEPAIANLYNNLAITYKELENEEFALEYHEKSLALAEKTRNFSSIAANHINIGILLEKKRAFKKALKHYKKSVHISEEHNLWINYINGLSSIANIYRKQHRYDEALILLYNAQKLAEQHGFKQGISRILANIGIIYTKSQFADKNLRKAEQYLKKSYRIATDIDMKAQAATILEELVALYQHQEQWKKAFTLHKKLAELRKNIINEQVQKSLAAQTVAHLSEERKILQDKNSEILEQQRILEDQAAEIDEVNKILTTRNHELIQTNTELEKLIAEKKVFLEIASHDLKNPLNSITLATSMLKDYYHRLTPEVVLQKITNIEKTAQRMREIITNFLDIAGLENGELKLYLLPLSVNTIVQDAMEEYQSIAIAKNIQLHYSTIPQDYSVMADTSAIRQCLGNFISNAIKYSPKGSQVYISAELIQEKSTIRLCIRDEGPGIPEAEQPKLFQRFSKLSTRPTAGESSTGLGLSIVKILAEAMNGSIGCNSTVGKGSTFYIEFPCLQPNKP